MTYIKYDLSKKQFIQFLKMINFISMNGGEGDLWKQIAEKELSRTFCVGYPYCDSKLVVEPGVKDWCYTTTSGTKLEASERVFPAAEQTIFSASLPKERENGYTHKFLEKLVNSPGFILFPEYEMLEAEKGSEQYESAIIMGLKPYCDREWDELPRSQKKRVDEARYLAEKESAIKQAWKKISTEEEYDYESEEYCDGSLEEYSVD